MFRQKIEAWKSRHAFTPLLQDEIFLIRPATVSLYNMQAKFMESAMMPWNWFWLPQIHFPFSGSVAQDIAPDTSWFFGAIRPGAGVGSIEQKVFETASYGKQLGLILDVLLPMAERGKFDTKQGKASLRKLKTMYEQIESVKAANEDQLETAAVGLLARLQANDPQSFDRVIAKVKSATSGFADLPL